MNTQVFWAQEVEAFAQAFYDPKRKPTDQGKLYTATDPAAGRFSDKLDEDEQETFRKTLTQFLRLYAAITQMVRIEDTDLEKLYTFGRLLRARLPKCEGGGVLAIDGDVGLEYYRPKKTSEGDAPLHVKCKTVLPQHPVAHSNCIRARSTTLQRPKSAWWTSGRHMGLP